MLSPVMADPRARASGPRCAPGGAGRRPARRRAILARLSSRTGPGARRERSAAWTDRQLGWSTALAAMSHGLATRRCSGNQCRSPTSLPLRVGLPGLHFPWRRLARRAPEPASPVRQTGGPAELHRHAAAERLKRRGGPAPPAANLGLSADLFRDCGRSKISQAGTPEPGVRPSAASGFFVVMGSVGQVVRTGMAVRGAARCAAACRSPTTRWPTRPTARSGRRAQQRGPRLPTR